MSSGADLRLLDKHPLESDSVIRGGTFLRIPLLVKDLRWTWSLNLDLSENLEVNFWWEKRGTTEISLFYKWTDVMQTMWCKQHFTSSASYIIMSLLCYWLPLHSRVFLQNLFCIFLDRSKTLLRSESGFGLCNKCTLETKIFIHIWRQRTTRVEHFMLSLN